MDNNFFTLMKFELLLVVIIFILLFLKLGKNKMPTVSLLHITNGLLLINLIAGFFGNTDGNLFANMFRTTELIVLEKNILNFGVFIISLQSFSYLKEHKHVTEFYILLLSTLMGMFFMISSQNIFMFYLGLELSTIPLAALSNFDLEKRRSGEAAMKYIISSAFSSGILLFGISLLYGATGSINFSEITPLLTTEPLTIFSFVLLFAGFAFKISAVPFHLWTADVYEGSPVPVTSYLSVISKGAILFVFVSVLYSVFQPLFETWYNVIYLISILTMVIGNLFAIRQNNLKRFLAFSSIAQVGFILVGISGNSPEGTASTIYFILIYIFSNLGAFGVISIVSALKGKENMDDYKGFYKTNPVLTWIFTISLFSLAGIPPTAGFFGKFFLIMAGAGQGNYILITIAALNMIISLYYYLKIVKAMFMDTNENPISTIKTDLIPLTALIICVVGIIITGFVGGCYEYIYSLITI
ncbi:MAG: NADH-quinone oxidoreductase subunit N [Fimbriimonadaceae bacterium]|nr:NADH-quinone oxidoreductase subunit N [Chitinophagales bacterium]